MLYPHLLTGLQLADGGRIIEATPEGDVLISYGVRVDRRTYHSLELTQTAAATLQQRLDEASARASGPAEIPAPAPQQLSVHPGDVVVLRQQPHRYLQWTVTDIDPGNDGANSSITFNRGNETQVLTWDEYVRVYSGHAARRAS